MTNDHELEAALARVMAAGPRTEAAERIAAKLESAPLPPQKRSLTWWPAALLDGSFAPAWPRVAALAGAAALGISIGLSGLGTRIATDLDLVRVAAADDMPTNVFDLDVGLRP
jgi:hypothetical protein